MRSYPSVTRLAVAVVAAAVLTLLTGCDSSADEGKSAEPSAAPATTTTTTESATPTAAPGEFAVSPGGVTTAVGADAQSTEDEYFRACNAARIWMADKGGDPKAQLEPYLASIQAPDAAPGPGTYNTAWTELSPERQAAAIVAAQAAADGLCG